MTPLAFVILIFVFGTLAVGGLIPQMNDNKTSVPDGEVDFSKYTDGSRDNLQLKTFGLKPCGENIAVNFLVDSSGSMEYGTKMQDLKNALNTFASTFPNAGVITLQSYSVEPTELVPFDKLFGESKPLFLQAVNNMKPLKGTFSKDAFIFAKSKLDAGRPKFPNHKFAMIFISDGIPETLATNKVCPGGITGPLCGQHPDAGPGACRCFANSQDPRTIAAQVKQSGVRVFTIAFLDAADQKFNTLLTNMMTEVASSPSDAYTAPVSSQLTDILKQIKVKFCANK